MDWIILAWDKVVAGVCEHGDEPLCYMKCVEFLGQPSVCYVLRKPVFHVVN